MKPAVAVRWPAIAALTAVSTLAQIGQFGMGFIVLPVWLAHQGLDAQRAGFFAASQWAGMLAGLVAAPALVARIGAKKTVLLGLATSIVAFSTIGALAWPLWIAPGVLTGLGIGLRWIANESWLYSLVPEELSGRVVGVHETLIATAGVIAPALAAWCGPDGLVTILAGLSFTFAAAIPLCLTASAQPASPVAREATPATPVSALVCLGMIVVAVGGIIDGALYGLFPLYATARGLSGTQATLLLSCLGLGGMALQFPVGWMADRAGLGLAVIVCAMASTLALVTFALATPLTWLFPASGLIVGGMNSAFITLGMYAAACSEKTALVRNMRLVSLAFTASSIVGPLVAGGAMKVFGNDILMWPLAIASGALAVFTLGICEGRRQQVMRESHASHENLSIVQRTSLRRE
ncbi:putative MFS-type transporter YcaD [Paraburkholderia caffeinitolerans]|uniref:Putative MFS-type transporter YcaD n=2 Tax=Paraburkholderia TaxID=1822464 RepID=A0A6J5FHE8_9BURK|nr:MFS transporter [Paraburkholderia caffeinitolerans]CAB3777708.1 putative MFS-type transporter YcaD [Paraburkholderia caffeinitolerans]